MVHCSRHEGRIDGKEIAGEMMHCNPHMPHICMHTYRASDPCGKYSFVRNSNDNSSLAVLALTVLSSAMSVYSFVAAVAAVAGIVVPTVAAAVAAAVAALVEVVVSVYAVDSLLAPSL